MATVLQWLGYGLCHQLPERSFAAGGVQVPVCARDTGIYLGFMIAILLLSLVDRERPSEPPGIANSIVLMLMVGIMAVDGVSSYAGWRTTTNEIRLLTGLTAGYALAGFTLPLLNGQLWRHAGSGRVLGPIGSRIAFYASLPVAYLFIMYAAPALGVVYPLAVGLAIVFTFTAVNLVIVCLLPPFERRATRLLDAAPAIIVALLFSTLEFVASSYLKLWVEKLAGVR